MQTSEVEVAGSNQKKLQSTEDAVGSASISLLSPPDGDAKLNYCGLRPILAHNIH